ncbi:hypothetical protein LTR56_007078 [Elasticomyces elasticus]|nr:hypothetical protein LTR56_007078 [Elasticomyces elasticus]KAK3664053.1 hypothetical protein LTR22_005016 [Elasticomyces elasticus]KAK4927622.1 hypothetical protein LTR49_005490 [Elasticomyces elasticus]KAK5766994.1 hypothetical protein LTS12_002758 [Elasticomyces elasticus]
MRFNLPPGQGPPQSPQQFGAQGQQTPQCAAVPATQQVPMQGMPNVNYGQYNAMPTTQFAGSPNQFIGNQQQMSFPTTPQSQNMFFCQDNSAMTNFDAGMPQFTAQAHSFAPAVGLGIANQQGQQQRMPMIPQAQSKSFGQHTPNMGTPTHFTNAGTPAPQMQPVFQQQMQPGVQQQFQPAIHQQFQPAIQQQSQHAPNPDQAMRMAQHQRNIHALTPEERFEFDNSPVMWPGSNTPMGTISQVRQQRPDLNPVFVRKLVEFAGKKAMQRQAAEMARREAQNLAFQAQQQAAMLAQAQSMQYTHNIPATPNTFAQNIVRPGSAAMSQPSPTPNQNATSNGRVVQGMGQHLAQVRAELTRRSNGSYAEYEDNIIAAMDSTVAGQEMSRGWAASLNMAHNTTGHVNQAGSAPQTFNTMHAPSSTPRAMKMAKPSPAKPRTMSGLAAAAAPPQPKPATPQRKRSAPTDFESSAGPAKKNRVEQPASGITDAGFNCAGMTTDCGKQGNYLDIGTKNNGVHCHDCCASIRREGRCVWQGAGYYKAMRSIKVHPQLQALIVRKFQVCKEMKEKSPNHTCPCSPHHIPPPPQESQAQAKESVQPPSTSSLPSLDHGAGTPSPIALSQPITPPARSDLAQTYSIGQPASAADSTSTSVKRKRESSTIAIDDGNDTTLTAAKRQKITAAMIAAVSPGGSSKADAINISDDEEVATQSAPSKCTATPLTGNDKILPRDRANSVLSSTTTTASVLDNNNNNVTQASAPVFAPSPAKCSGPVPFSAALTQWLATEEAKNAAPVKRAYSPRKPSLPKQKQAVQDMTVQTAEPTHITGEGYLVGPIHVTGPMAGYREVKMINATQSAMPTVPRPAQPGQTFVEGLGYQNRLPDVNDPIEMILHRYLAPAVKFARQQDSPVQVWAHGVAPDWNDFGKHVQRLDSFGKMRCDACDKTGITCPGVLRKIHEHFAGAK